MQDVVGDRYAAEFVAEQFRAHGIDYTPSAQDRSAIYLETLPRVNARTVILLDVPELLRELRGLERHRGPSGRDRVDHASGAHDDLANAAAGALVLAALEGARPALAYSWQIPQTDAEGEAEHQAQADVLRRAVARGGGVWFPSD